MATLSPIPAAATNGQNTAGGTITTMTLPSYSAGDYLLLVINTNQSQASFTFSAAISSSAQLANAGGRIVAYQITPNGAGQTTFTVTVPTTAVWTWWIGNYSGASLSLATASGTNAQGNSTSSAVAMPEAGLSWIATGGEVMISAAGVNSTAAWTTDSGTQFHTTANNAAMLADAVNPAAGILTGTPVSVDRGNNGSSRNQNSLTVVLQPPPGGTTNLLANPSFETGSPLATGWTDEHTTQTEATYAITGSGVVDGTVAQQFSYSGVSGDGGTAKTEMYQAPITGVAPGNYLTFSCWLSGSLTKTYAFIGIESFTSGGAYISEADTNVLTLTGTPVKYSVSYLCPAGTDHVAVYIQCPEIGATTVLSVIMDKAALTVGTAPHTGRSTSIVPQLLAAGAI